MNAKTGIALKIVFAVLILLGNTGLTQGQTAAELEALLNTGEITWAEAAYFIRSSGAETDPAAETTRPAAFQFFREQGWLPKNAEADGAARLGGLSLVLMRSFNIPGGLMYRLFHNARYAYRELKALGVLPDRSYAADRVSGAEFLQILGGVLSYAEEAEAPPPTPDGAQERKEPENSEGDDREIETE